VRDAELYRRPPFFVGDEAAVLRQRRAVRRRRRAVQGAFGAGVVALGLALRAYGADGLLPAAAAFALISSAFMPLHLAVGKRMWMKPVEAYEDGVAASQITALFCRRRFVAWKDVEGVVLEPAAGGGGEVLVVRAAGGRRLESVPGEVDGKAVEAMRQRMAAEAEDAQRRRAIFDSVGPGGGSHP
jgi:hypothetical protein